MDKQPLRDAFQGLHDKLMKLIQSPIDAASSDLIRQLDEHVIAGITLLNQ